MPLLQKGSTGHAGLRTPEYHMAKSIWNVWSSENDKLFLTVFYAFD